MEKAANDVLVPVVDMFFRINERFRIMGYGGTEAIDNQPAHRRFFPQIPQAAFSKKHGKAAARGVARSLDRICPVGVGRPKKA
jgi:hypothetical protein